MLDVLILAAGRGERLQPLTDFTPKPLLRLGAQTLLEHHLHRLRAQGFENVVINLAWLGGQIRDYIGDGRRFGLRIRYSEESQGALETGGGIVYALDLLQSDPFVVINGDIFSDFDYARLRIPPRATPYAMHLVMVPNPPHNPGGDFSLVAGELRRTAAAVHNSTYAGIGCFRREVFDALDPVRFPLWPLIENAIAEHRASATLHVGQWFDIGSPERLEQARRQFHDPAPD